MQTNINLSIIFPLVYFGSFFFSQCMIDLFLPFGFVTIGQDMRGTQTSEGTFSIWHSDAEDSQDLGDWAVAQQWSNGDVFTFGASADGLAAFTTAMNQPSWLKSQYFVWASSLGSVSE